MDQDAATNNAEISNGIVITPDYNFDTRETTLRIRGLKKGAHIVLSVPSNEQECNLFIGQLGKVHAFGISTETNTVSVTIGP